MIAAAYALAGTVLGIGYFTALWRHAQHFARGSSWLAMVGWGVVRIGLLGGVLVLVSFAGAIPLLATALGIWAGRLVVLRQVRRGAA